MGDSVEIIDSLTQALHRLSAQLVEYLPKVVVAVLVLTAGWLLARLLRYLVMRAVGGLDHLWQRLVSRPGLGKLPAHQSPTKVAGAFVFWLVMLVFVTLAADILGLHVFGAWLQEIVSYLPLALAGLLIVLVGYIVSTLVRDLVTSAAESANLTHGDLLGRTAQAVLLLIAIIIGIGQIGIDTAFLSVIAGIILASMLGGIALAFGLGARTHVSNIIAANQLRQVYQVGDIVRIGDIEGRVIDIMVSRVIIETEKGTVDIPAKVFDEEVTSIIEKGA